MTKIYGGKCRACRKDMPEDNIFCSQECKSSWFMDYDRSALAQA